RRHRPRQHDETGTDARPVDDPDADPAVDGGAILGSGTLDSWKDGKQGHTGQGERHSLTFQPSNVRAFHCRVPEKENRTNSTPDPHPSGRGPNARRRPAFSTAPWASTSHPKFRAGLVDSVSLAGPSR